MLNMTKKYKYMRPYYHTRTGTIRWDWKERKEKAQKIYAVISDFAVADISKMSCLDVGCGCGAIIDFMGHHFARAVGIDIDAKLIQQAISQTTNERVSFFVTDATRMGFSDKTFDVVIANQVYEHVPDANRLMDEIRRVLKDDGFCYFAGPNRMQLIEPHRHLPLLHWLPKKLADAYLRAVRGHRPYDVKLMDYWSLRKMIRRRFEIIDYTVPVLTRPDKFQVEDRMRKPLLTLVPGVILTALVLFPWFHLDFEKEVMSVDDFCGENGDRYIRM